MIENLTVSIIPYGIPVLNEEDIESLTNFIVQVTELGFEYTIDNGRNPKESEK